MPEPQAVSIPLLNPNEPEALLAAVHVTEGQHVAEGEVLCTLETTKSTAELTAEREGYVVQLALQAGQTVHAGERLCYLADTPDWKPNSVLDVTEIFQNTAGDQSLPAGLRISQPALKLARELGMELSLLPQGVFVTENMVRELAVRAGLPAQAQPAFDPTAILIYGGGGHGKALIDLLRALKVYRIVGIIDDHLSRQEPGQQIMGLPILGGAEALPKLYQQGIRLAVNAVGGIGNISVRIRVFERLAAEGFHCPALIHPTAFVEPSAQIAGGVQVFPLAYIGSEAQIGYGAIINTGAIVSHDCRIGDYVNLSPGAILAGEVQVGEGTLIGMGVTINLRTRIGRGARVGNSAVVKADVPDEGVVRAGTIWPD